SVGAGRCKPPQFVPVRHDAGGGVLEATQLSSRQQPLQTTPSFARLALTPRNRVSQVGMSSRLAPQGLRGGRRPCAWWAGARSPRPRSPQSELRAFSPPV